MISTCHQLEVPSIKPASWTLSNLVGALNAWNGRLEVVPWPILFEKVVPKRQINHHYFWVCKIEQNTGLLACMSNWSHYLGCTCYSRIPCYSSKEVESILWGLSTSGKLRNGDGWSGVWGRLFQTKSVMERRRDDHFRHLGHPPKFYRVQDAGFINGFPSW